MMDPLHLMGLIHSPVFLYPALRALALRAYGTTRLEPARKLMPRALREKK